jgi:hypothetical protein
VDRLMNSTVSVRTSWTIHNHAEICCQLFCLRVASNWVQRRRDCIL